MPADPSAVLLQLGIQVATRAAPKGVQWLSAKFFWNDIIIVGQPRAGKTSFSNFLRLGVFTSTATERTLVTSKSAPFVVPIGRDRALLMKVRGAIDTVGQASAAEHSTLCRKHRPQIIVVVLDLEADWKGPNEYAAEFYLTEFFSHFLTEYNRNKGLRGKLKKVIVLLNKRDVVSAKKAASWINHVETYVRRTIANSAADLRQQTKVMECSLVEDYNDGRFPAAVLQEMAISLESSKKVS
jgi:hypothetical protein